MRQEDKIYLYQDSLISLLNLIEFLIKNKIKPLNIKDSNCNPTLLDEIVRLEIKENKQIIKKIINKWGKTIFKIVYYTYLSSDPNKELIIYYFLLNCIKYNNNVINRQNLTCVSASLKLAKYVSREAHKMKGFLRFSELKNNILYAEIEPTNNVIEILSVHFKNRLKNEYWIIFDKKRDIVSIYDKTNFYLINGNNIRMNLKDKKEDEYENMWKDFYRTVGISERKNDKCRLNFMPKKYWKNMLEVREEK